MPTKIIKLGLFLALAYAVFGQTLTPTTPTTSIRPGDTIQVSATLAGSTAVVATQYSVNVATGMVIGTVTTSAANKRVACGTAVPKSCIVYGNDTTTLTPGAIAAIPVTAPVTLAKGSYQISFSAVNAGNVAAQPLTVTSTPLTILVLSRYDLNGDGLTNDTDLDLCAAQIVGTATCTTADFNGDGKCDSLDMILLITKGIQQGL